MSTSSSSTTTTSSLPLPSLLTTLLTSTSSLLSLSTSPGLTQFLSLLQSLPLALHAMQTHAPPPTPDLLSSLSSLDAKLNLVRHSLRTSSPSPRLLEDSARGIGRCLGTVMLDCEGAAEEVTKGIWALHRELMGVDFDEFDAPQPPVVVVEVGGMDLEDVLMRVKNGEEGEELRAAVEELGVIVTEGSVGEESVGFVVSVLVNRLGCAKDGLDRLGILLLLRRLAALDVRNKEMMADPGTLSTIVRSLTRDITESREAVGLLFDLSDIPKVHQRIGRVQGCMVMLVILLNGDDPSASSDAGKLLHALSSNTQNVLLMSEAGYFSPMVHYLREGSDMIKILMATSLSRMKLSDKMKTALGKEGSIEPLVDMFNSGKLEAKLSSLSALKNLSTLPENIQILINSGIVAPLLQLLFSVTSVFVTLREPAAAILACIAQSELILNVKDVAPQILSLIGLSRPLIQCHLLHALSRIASHPRASKVRSRMKRKGILELILPFLTENENEIRRAALDLLFALSKDLADQIGEAHLSVLVGMFKTSAAKDETVTAAGILSNLPANDKKVTDILSRLNLLPILVVSITVCLSVLSNTMNKLLLENIAGVVIRFTVPWDKKLQRETVDLGVIPLLVKLLSYGSPIAQSRAATSLANLSQNSLSLGKSKMSRWMCLPPSSEALCEVHGCRCTVKGTFCLVKACAISPLVQILKDKDREADEAVLSALATLMQDDIWENGSNAIDKASGVEAMVGVLEVGNLNAQERALWMLEKIFRIENHREKHGITAQFVLLGLAQKGDSTLKPLVAKILAHLKFLQSQSSYV